MVRELELGRRLEPWRLKQQVTVPKAVPPVEGNDYGIMGRRSYGGRWSASRGGPRRGGRVVDGSGLENQRGESLRGFESRPLRFCIGVSGFNRVLRRLLI